MYANHKGRKGFIDLCSIFVSSHKYYLGNRVYDIITSRGKITKVSGNRQSFAFFTFPSAINQHMFISIHF